MNFTFTKYLLTTVALSMTTSYSSTIINQTPLGVGFLDSNNSQKLSDIVFNKESIEDNSEKFKEFNEIFSKVELSAEECTSEDIEKFIKKIQDSEDTHSDNFSYVFSRIAQNNVADDSRKLNYNQFQSLSKLFASRAINNDNIFDYQHEELLSAVIYSCIKNNNFNIIKNLKKVENQEQLNEALNAIGYNDYYTNGYLKQLNASKFSDTDKKKMADFHKSEAITISSWNHFVKLSESIDLNKTLNQFIQFINTLRK